MPKVTPRPAKKTPTPHPPAEERKVEYPKVKSSLCIGEDALTVVAARQLLGWTEVDKGGMLTHEGKQILLTNSSHNRPFTESLAQQYAQEHLNRRWRLNGETIVIGKYGEVLSGQHRLVSLILAESQRLAQLHHWKAHWPGPVTMETLVVFGIDEKDEIVNTLDTGKPRSESDVLYRSKYFAHLEPAKRKAYARATAYAVRMLWKRTGAATDPFAPTRTHAEMFSFIERHVAGDSKAAWFGKPGIIAAVAHIMEEQEAWAASKFSHYGAGYAAALLYLMAAGESDGDRYRNADPASQKVLNMDRWDRACEFWVYLGGGTDLHEIRHGLGALYNKDGTGKPSLEEKTAVIILGWNLFVQGAGISRGDCELPSAFYKVVETIPGENPGDPSVVIRRLSVHPTVGGIDLGWGKEEAEEETSEEGTEQQEGQAPVPKVTAPPPRANGEVKKPEPVQHDADGKPPAPRLLKKPLHKAEETQEAAPVPLAQQLAALKAKHPEGTVLILQIPGGYYVMWGEDAKRCGGILKMGLTAPREGLHRLSFESKRLPDVQKKLDKAGVKYAVVSQE